MGEAQADSNCSQPVRHASNQRLIVEYRLVPRHLEPTMLGVDKAEALRPLVGTTLPVPLPLRSEDSAPREGTPIEQLVGPGRLRPIGAVNLSWQG